MTPEQVTAVANDLDSYANHFAHRDWNYTRGLGFNQRVVRKPDPLRRRVRSATRSLRELFHQSDADLFGKHRFKMRFRVALIHLKGLDPQPDGSLDGGCIITHWEETGEYLQYVQPSVGALIADWMKTEPENEHAVKVAAEMARIQRSYSTRLAREAYEDGE